VLVDAITSDIFNSYLVVFDKLSGSAIWIKSPRPFGSARPKSG
jgi:hypothetical protein